LLWTRRPWASDVVEPTTPPSKRNFEKRFVIQTIKQALQKWSVVC